MPEPAVQAGAGSEGLTSIEAVHRLQVSGRNEIRQPEPVSPWKLLAGQFASPLIWLLFGACAISIAMGEVLDAIAIGAIVCINAVIGFLQESRAERALLALRAMTAPRARVLRDGRATIIPSAEVVAGDVLLLEAGDVVAADGRLLEAYALAINEAPLTGESLPVEKTTRPASPDAPLMERHDSVFLGTSVANGSGRALIVGTGMRTELGRIAQLIETAQPGPTPLQVNVARVARTLLIICLGIVACVGVAGLLHGDPWTEVLLFSVSLAVAAVPEGLPAIVTIALALGVQRLVKRHVLVRRLAAVETLGCVTTVCTDKTGTLTAGSMAVREVIGTDQRGILHAAAACCDAELGPDGAGGVGDPTEIALLQAAAGLGIRREEIERERPRVAVMPFDSDRKRMSILRADGHLYVKGAFESVAPCCASGVDGASDLNARLAAAGLRVLAIATGAGPDEKDLLLLGLVGLADPPRPDAVRALAEARRAGIATVMITGDHPATALAIAREMGLSKSAAEEAERIHARATAHDKLQIVRALKARGEIVAMTGDGVNDAPALREAHIGIAMGRGGTEVTREAASMVLTDDNYASIVAAIQEGRGIYDNIRKSLVYLLAGNTGEILLVLGTAILGLPLPLLPVQLLWINLVTDGFPALALVTDPPEADLLERPPRPPAEHLLGRPQWRIIVLTGLLEASVTLSSFVWVFHTRDLVAARTFVFSVVVLAEVFRAFAARSDTRVFWEVGAVTNLRLLAVVVVSAGLQLALAHAGVTEKMFRIGPLSMRETLLTAAAGLIPVTVLELSKLVRRRYRRAIS